MNVTLTMEDVNTSVIISMDHMPVAVMMDIVYHLMIIHVLVNYTTYVSVPQPLDYALY